MAVYVCPDGDVLDGKADNLPVAAYRGTGPDLAQRHLVTGRYQPGDDDTLPSVLQCEAGRQRLQRDSYRIVRVQVYRDVPQARSTGRGRLNLNSDPGHPDVSVALLASGMQRRLVVAIVLGIFAMVALFIASALLPPMLLAVALMVVVLLAFVAVALFWRGE
jgi:hypothetical protein